MAEYRRFLPLLGIFLVVVGNLIPWECHTGFSTGCARGLEWRYPNFPVSSTAVILLVALILIIMFILYQTGLAPEKILWIELVLVTFLCVILYTPIIFPPTRFYHLVHPLIVVSSAVLLWLVLFPFARSATWKRVVDYCSLALALLATVRLCELVVQQVYPVGLDIEVSTKFGLPLVIIGSIIVGLPSTASRVSIESAV